MSNVYFIKPVGLDGPIKIGWSTTPSGRLISLTAWSPWPLEIMAAVPGTSQDEKFIHQCFAEDHSHREWFRSSRKLRAIIEKMAAANSVQPARDELQPVKSIRAHVIEHWSPAVKLRVSYSMRIGWAEKKLRRLAENGAWRRPDDIYHIMSKWSGYGSRPSVPPTPEELDRIHEYLADPAPHSVIPSWLREEQAA